MPKCRIFRNTPAQGRGSGQAEARVVEFQTGLQPMQSVPVPDETPVSDWAAWPPAETPAGEEN